MIETGKEKDVDSCCCGQVTVVKTLITVLALINLALVATGCLGISLTLLEHWSKQHLFTPVMAASGVLLCWGTFAITMDVLVLLGISQGRKVLLLPWLVWYILEVITFAAVVLISVVYTKTFLLMPLLIKTILTTVTWFQVRNIYQNSFGSFYTRNTNSVLKNSPVFCVYPLRK